MADDGWIDTTGTEFGEVDNPTYSGNSMAPWDNTQWNKGAGGYDLSGWNNQGVALPNVPLGTRVQLRNPDTGATTTATVVDSGPGESTGAGIDMLAGTRSALGYPVNYKGPVQYQLVSGSGSTAQTPTQSTLSSAPSLASNQTPVFPTASTAQQQPKQQQQQPKPQEEYKPPAIPALKGMQTAQLDPALQQNAQQFAQTRANAAQNAQKQAVDYTKSYDVLAKYFGEEDGGSGSSDSSTSSTTV